MCYSEDKLVALLSKATALKCGVCPTVAKQIRTAAALHDIGKVKIPDSILNKPGKLNKQEFEVMKTHTCLGAALLSGVQGELGVMARAIAYYHHEWYNGQGYWGKYPCDLPEYVPIVSISDMFVALVSIRAYKTAWPVGEALEYIRTQAGTQFSPALVEIFIPLARQLQTDNGLVDKMSTSWKEAFDPCPM